MSKINQFPQDDAVRPSKFASILAGIFVGAIALAVVAVSLAIPVIIWAWILTL